jgi:hypothetical protein
MAPVNLFPVVPAEKRGNDFPYLYTTYLEGQETLCYQM